MLLVFNPVDLEAAQGVIDTVICLLPQGECGEPDPKALLCQISHSDLRRRR